MHLDIPENKKLKLESDQYLGDVADNYSDYVKTGNAELDMEKKKRRGKIEKRRRDRINNSLAELKELVPNAIAKQNTTKLEKAEILKLAVDHLKELKSKESTKSYGPYTRMYESKIAGFRDCFNEVSKYLHREGISNQNPLYQGLMEHLQYFYQSIITQATYQSEITSPIDPSIRYSQLQSPLTPFDNTVMQTYHDNYQKLSSWNNSMPSQYANQPPQYPTQANNYQPNILFQLNSHQQSSSYPNNIGTNPIMSTNSNLNSVFKCTSTSSKIGIPINTSHVHTSTHPSSGINFPSFCNDPINFFHSMQPPGQELP